MLEKPLGGRGILLGGVPGVAAAKVVIIGGGVVGMNAALIALGREATVFVSTATSTGCASSTSRSAGARTRVTPRRWTSRSACPRPTSDRRGARARREGAVRDPPRALVADEAQARCSSTWRSTRAAASRPRADDAHRPDLHGRRRGPLLRGQHARRGAGHLHAALTNATLPYVLHVADFGVEQGRARQPGPGQGRQRRRRQGDLRPVAEATGLPYTNLFEALA